MNVALKQHLLDSVEPEQRVEVIKAFYEAAGTISTAVNQPMGLGAGIAVAGVALAMALAAYALCKYVFKDA